MTDIQRWIAAAARMQPAGTLGIFCYVRDGLLHVSTPVEMRDFPTADILLLPNLIREALDKAYETGPTAPVTATAPAFDPILAATEVADPLEDLDDVC